MHVVSVHISFTFTHAFKLTLQREIPLRMMNAFVRTEAEAQEEDKEITGAAQRESVPNVSSH